MPICIYPPLAEDFTTNGLGILTPLECTVEEQAAGKYEIELVHPIDSTLRWMQIQNGCIVKVPAPVRENPLYEAPAIEAAAPVTVTRQVWRATDGQHIRQKPDRLSKKMGSVRKGGEVIELADAHDPWKKICAVKGGQVGYMSTRYLKAVRTITETIQPAKPPVVVGSVEINQSRDQLFRIYSVEQDSEAGTVTAKGMHVFYDDAGNLINAKYEPKNATVAAVMSKIASSLHQAAEVDFQAFNLTGKITGDFSYKTPVEAYLDPDEGIVAQTGAMLFRDNWEAYLLPDMVRDLGVTIRRGKNLIGVEVTNDISDVVTRIIPIGKNKNGNPIGLSGTGYMDSSHINEYPFPRVKRIEYDVQTGKDGFNSDTAVRNELRRLAQEDFKNGADLPTYGMDVDFVLLQNTAEYENFASLQAVHLYDTVTVIDEMLGLKAKVRVTGYKWDCLTEQYESVTLGELQDVKQTVYSFNLPNKGVSGNKIMNNSLDGTAMRDASIEYAKITVAAIEQLTAESVTALTARIKELVAGSVTTDELYAGIADITKATIEKAEINWASIDELNAAIATLVQANIGTADIDFARIKDMVTDTAIITQGVGGELFISRLAVTEANMVSLTTGELVVKGEDGHFYSLNVDASGNIVTTLKQLNNDDVQDLSINAGEKLIEGSVTAACLNAREIFADNAIIRELIAANLDVDKLFAREAFVNLLRTSKIVGDKSITMLAGEVDNLDRLSNIEVIEGTFAQTERREGEGIRIYSEIEPKQDLKWGAPWPGGAGKNLLPNNATSKTVNGVTFTVNADGTVTANGTATANTYFYIDIDASALIAGTEYILSGCPDGGSTSTYRVAVQYYDSSNAQKFFGNDMGAGSKFTRPETMKNPTWFIVVLGGVTVSNLIFKPMIRLASNTDPTYAPYSNTPPIEGWTGLDAGHRGKNLCGSVEDIVVQNGPSKATMTQNGNVFTLSTTSEYGGDGFFFGYGVFKKGKKYTVSGTVAGYVNVRIYDKTNMNTWLHLITPDANGNFALTFEATSDNVVFRVWVSVSAACTLSNFQIEEGDLTPYEPYQGNTYFLDFGETVYGGKVDWHAGEMTVNKVYLELDGTEKFSGYASGAARLPMFTPALAPKISGDIYSNMLKSARSYGEVTSTPNSVAALQNGIVLHFAGLQGADNVIFTDIIAKLTSLKAAGTPVQLVYELAEPYTIQLTPVQIETLQGINTVYTDADGGRVEFGHSPIDDIQNAVDALEEAQAESALYLKLDAENKVVRIGQTEVTSEFDIDAYGAGVVVGGKTFSRFEGERVLIGDMEMRKPANIGGLAFDSIMT